MVDTFQPRRLSCFRIRKRRHEDRMNQEKTKTPKPSQHDMGWKAQRTFPLLPVAGEIFLLTFPFYRTALLETNPTKSRQSPAPKCTSEVMPFYGDLSTTSQGTQAKIRRWRFRRPSDTHKP